MKVFKIAVVMLIAMAFAVPSYAAPKGKSDAKGLNKSITDMAKKQKAVKTDAAKASVPSGLTKKGEMPKGLEKKDKTPAGWGKGTKEGWKTSTLVTEGSK